MQDQFENELAHEHKQDNRHVSDMQEEASPDRRKFLSRIGWGSLAAFAGINTYAFLRFFYPRVLFEPPSKFKVGFPSDYPPGVVNSQYTREFGTWIIRLQDGRFFAMEAKCTHLGCTPNWMESQNKFKCPCHGSGYYITGLNFEGPAPRPMDRFKISIADDGQLQVDKTIKYPGIPGSESNDVYPQSLLNA